MDVTSFFKALVLGAVGVLLKRYVCESEKRDEYPQHQKTGGTSSMFEALAHTAGAP